MEWFIDGETGLPAESAKKVKKHLEELKNSFKNWTSGGLGTELLSPP